MLTHDRSYLEALHTPLTPAYVHKNPAASAKKVLAMRKRELRKFLRDNPEPPKFAPSHEKWNVRYIQLLSWIGIRKEPQPSSAAAAPAERLLMQLPAADHASDRMPMMTMHDSRGAPSSSVADDSSDDIIHDDSSSNDDVDDVTRGSKMAARSASDTLQEQPSSSGTDDSSNEDGDDDNVTRGQKEAARFALDMLQEEQPSSSGRRTGRRGAHTPGQYAQLADKLTRAERAREAAADAAIAAAAATTKGGRKRTPKTNTATTAAAASPHKKKKAEHTPAPAPKVVTTRLGRISIPVTDRYGVWAKQN